MQQYAAPIAEYVVEAFEDSKGTLWFGTMNKGVARWDGKALTYLTEKDGLCGNTIVSIAEDNRGNLWFAGHTSACSYDGTTFTSRFDVESSVRKDRKGNIWVSTNMAVFRLDGASFTEFKVPLAKERPPYYSIVPGRVTFQMEDSQGHLWFSTDGFGALRYDPFVAIGSAQSAWTKYTKKDGLCSNTPWSIIEDKRGRIWFGCVQAFQPTATGDGGVCVLEGEHFTTFPEVAGLNGNDIYTIYEERSGKIWIGATGLGAYLYDPAAALKTGGERFILIKETDRPDLTKNFGLQAMVEDRNGMRWCGFSGGLFRLQGDRFVHVGQGGPWK